jgi:hypothetical protein
MLSPVQTSLKYTSLPSALQLKRDNIEANIYTHENTTQMCKIVQTFNIIKDDAFHVHAGEGVGSDVLIFAQG